MTRHLVNVERRFSMQPGALPDKEIRTSMQRGWMVSVVDADGEAPVVLRISEVLGDDNYIGAAVNVIGMPQVRLHSFNVKQIISTTEASNGKNKGATPAEEDLHHAIQAQKISSLPEVWASLDDRLQRRPSRW